MAGSGTSTGACTSGTAPITGGSLGAPLLLTHTTASVAATKAIPLFIQGAIGPFSTLSAAQNFVNTPDIATTFKCYPDCRRLFRPPRRRANHERRIGYATAAGLQPLESAVAQRYLLG